MKQVIAFSMLLITLCSCEQQSITQKEPTTSTDQVTANSAPATFGGTSMIGLSQVKYSFEEVPYSPAEMTKKVTIYSSGIKDAQGNPKYKVTASIDTKNKLLADNYVYLSGEGIKGESCQIQITHVGHLYLGGGVNTGGVEAYACRFKSTNVVFYFLAGATTSNTLKFLFYVPSGPQTIQLGNG